MTMRFRVLGAVEAFVNGRSVDLGHRRQRCVLAVMLVEANRTVSTDELIDRAWGPRVPRRARDTLYSYLSRLRRALAATDDFGLVHRSDGYLLTIDENAVDLHRFCRLVDRARAAVRDDHAAALFGQAFRLWYGDAFHGLDTPWINAVRESVRQARFAAELDAADRQLRCGEHTRLVTDLSARAAAYPLDERLAGQLLLALYRCGRQADALRHYQRTRLRLADEFGADPTPPLQELHRRILINDATLAIAP